MRISDWSSDVCSSDLIVQFLDRGVDIVLLRPQRRDPLTAARDRHVALGAAAVADIVEVDHLADLAQREADALAAQYPREPRAIAMRIDALRPPPLGRDQPLVLIETQRARRDLELGRQIRTRTRHATPARRDRPTGRDAGPGGKRTAVDVYVNFDRTLVKIGRARV